MNPHWVSGPCPPMVVRYLFAYKRKTDMLTFFVDRLFALQQPRQRHHRPQIRLQRRGGHGLLHFLSQNALLQTQQTHHPLFLQRGEIFLFNHGALLFVYC